MTAGTLYAQTRLNLPAAPTSRRPPALLSVLALAAPVRQSCAGSHVPPVWPAGTVSRPRAESPCQSSKLVTGHGLVASPPIRLRILKAVQNEHTSRHQRGCIASDPIEDTERR